MLPGDGFAAALLERGAVGFGAYAASALLEAAPEAGAPPHGFSTWHEHLAQRVRELAAAVAVGEPQVFVARVEWGRRRLAARGESEEPARRSLQQLRSVLVENLPEDVAPAALDPLDRAAARFEQGPPDLEPSRLDPALPTDRQALRFLERALSGAPSEAVEELARAVADGSDVSRVYTDVLLPALHEVGRSWAAGEMTTAEEHLVSAAAQRAMARLVSAALSPPPNGRTVVAASVAGNQHELGVRATSDLFQLAGWRVIALGANQPTADLVGSLRDWEADLLLLCATLCTQLPEVVACIAAVRESAQRDVKILVGGAAFDETPDLWRRLGSDGYAPTIGEAVARAAGLVGLPG